MTQCTLTKQSDLDGSLTVITEREESTSRVGVDLLGLPFERLASLLDHWGVGRAQAKRVFRGVTEFAIDLSRLRCTLLLLVTTGADARGFKTFRHT